MSLRQMLAHASVEAEPDVPATSATDADHFADLDKKTYLDTEQAAFYLSYTRPKYQHPVKAFMATVYRLGPGVLPRLHFNRRVMFSRVDLDRVLKGRR